MSAPVVDVICDVLEQGLNFRLGKREVSVLSQDHGQDFEGGEDQFQHVTGVRGPEVIFI